MPRERYEHVLQRWIRLARLTERLRQAPRLAFAALDGDEAEPAAEQVCVLERRRPAHPRERREGIVGDRDLENAAAQVVLEVVGSALGDDAAAENEREAVALLRLVHVVRRDEHRHSALRGELVDEVPEHAPSPGIHTARRL